jgi:uncharacterized membrane protein
MFENILMSVFRLSGHLVGRLIRLVFDVAVFGVVRGFYAWRHKQMEVIPLEAHFAHTLIVAGTGHGKTQLLQQLILYRIDDLLAEIESKNKNPSSPSQYRNPPRRLKWIIPAIYGLLLLVWFVDLAPIIGLILAFTQRKAAVDTIYASHLRNQILVFCVGVGSLIVVALITQYADPGIAKILLIAAICWIGWRITKGFYRAICQKEYSSPNPKSQKVQGDRSLSSTARVI